MPAILLVDDDHDTWEAVRLALEPLVKVHVIGSLYGALSFVQTREHELSGVIVDLNLTEGSDNFGRVLLERLREMAMPCVVFSSSIRSPADAQRYEIEFGVLGTIGKGGTGAGGAHPLQQLRDCVDRMVAASLELLREQVRTEVEHDLARRETAIERERRRSDELIAETGRIAGKSAASRLSTAESARIQGMANDAKTIRDATMDKIRAAATIEDLASLRRDTLPDLAIR